MATLRRGSGQALRWSSGQALRRGSGQAQVREWTVIESRRGAPPAIPIGARLADVASMALVVAGITVSLSGGFRIRVGEWRFALTTLWMLIAMIVAVRQALDYRSTARAIGVCTLGLVFAVIIAFAFGMFFGPAVS